MKSLLETDLPHDERQDQVNGHSSYIAIVSLFVLFFIPFALDGVVKTYFGLSIISALVTPAAFILKRRDRIATAKYTAQH